MLVLKILEAPEYSLILLDEPEVSLHPGAQERLKIFLLEQIKLKKHQIIITSHSPSIVTGLPKEAIKVFYQNPNSGRFLVKEDLTAEEAFYHIEFPLVNKKNIIVEDILAKEILSELLISIGHGARDIFNIKFNPGGESVLKTQFINVFSREVDNINYIFFDGDQKLLPEKYDWRLFSSNDLNTNFLKQKIIEQLGIDVDFHVDSLNNRGNDTQRLDLQKKYLDFCLKNVFYLPKNIPEEIIWNNDLAEKNAQAILDATKYSLYNQEINSESGFKEKFSIYTKYMIGNNRSEDILSIQKLFIQKWINDKDENYNILLNNIRSIM
jgi:hypothetical protein